MSDDIMHRLAGLYAEMQAGYEAVADELGLTCTDCPDNCCTSFFQHHTHVEWAYLWTGLMLLPDAQRRDIRIRAAQYVADAQKLLADHKVPDLMCLLNIEGRCSIYSHRLMICRLHGVPNRFTLPGGQSRTFPGCFRCQEIVAGQSERLELDRTIFYQQLAKLEMDFIRTMPEKPMRVRLTLAEMILKGPPMEGRQTN